LLDRLGFKFIKNQVWEINCDKIIGDEIYEINNCKFHQKNIYLSVNQTRTLDDNMIFVNIDGIKDRYRKVIQNLFIYLFIY